MSPCFFLKKLFLQCSLLSSTGVYPFYPSCQRVVIHKSVLFIPVYISETEISFKYSCFFLQSLYEFGICQVLTEMDIWSTQTFGFWFIYSPKERTVEGDLWRAAEEMKMWNRCSARCCVYVCGHHSITVKSLSMSCFVENPNYCISLSLAPWREAS